MGADDAGIGPATQSDPDDGAFWLHAQRYAVLHRGTPPILVYEALKSMWRARHAGASHHAYEAALRRIIDIAGV